MGDARKFPRDRNDYWAKRQDALFYRYTTDMVEKFAPDAESVIDVGCFVSPIVCQLDWIPKRFANDIQYIPEWEDVPDVTFVKGNAFELDVEALCGKASFDVVISHQTIEHIDDAKGFAESLCRMGSMVICSTSYEVEGGLVPGHVQDPISLKKFEGWFPRPAKSVLIERRGDPRFANILGVF
ncbi:hypothetical protein [Maritimibacter alkaliphilus]|uniref:hypothetical protein n=1 Tax=Maritimibacter alkaliphilus TaxID=404236 RepID=UPI001C96DF62|nr:hypothetical protein [Maritimibacter alkaliphilus]MBY6092899.1 hypothetical protein [Maritimibacter alkaliphilus]